MPHPVFRPAPVCEEELNTASRHAAVCGFLVCRASTAHTRSDRLPAAHALSELIDPTLPLARAVELTHSLVSCTEWYQNRVTLRHSTRCGGVNTLRTALLRRVNVGQTISVDCHAGGFESGDASAT